MYNYLFRLTTIFLVLKENSSRKGFNIYFPSKHLLTQAYIFLFPKYNYTSTFTLLAKRISFYHKVE